MPALDHVNIQTNRLDETVAFWRDIVGLEARDAPGADPSVIQWMFDEEGRGIVHVGKVGAVGGDVPAEISPTTGAIHHVALDCAGHDAMLAKLEEHGLPYRLCHIAPIDLRQIFIHDPNGVLVELNFRPGRQ